MNHPERREQDAIVKLLRLLKADVRVLGTTRRHGDHPGTMQSPGLPDLYVFLPAKGTRLAQAIWIEVKAPGQKIRPGTAQDVFREKCRAAGHLHLTGTADDVRVWLEARGYLPSSNRSEAPHAATT